MCHEKIQHWFAYQYSEVITYRMKMFAEFNFATWPRMVKFMELHVNISKF